MKTLSMAGIACIMFMALTISLAQAHDLWIAKRDMGYVVARGHIPDRLDPYNPQCIKDLDAYDKKGQRLSLQRVIQKDSVWVSIASNPAMVTVASIWGDRVIDKDGKKHFLNKAEAQKAGLTVRESFRSTQFSKTLLDFDDALTKPVGMKFEVVPGKNPRSLKVGDVLPIQVFFDGVPLQAGKIYRGRGPTTLATDSGGVAQIAIETKGWQKVVVIHDVPAPDQAAIDYDRYFAFLVFEIM